VLAEHITQSILVFRGHKVLLDEDLAALYGVATKVLLQAVKRNRERFPEDFMIQLTPEEWAALRSRTVTSKPQRGGRRYLPFAFTEQGVAMLSSVLVTAGLKFVPNCRFENRRERSWRSAGRHSEG